ncbi:MAG: protein-L-isoaspartate(D-aspartate) O-methyltransferase [Myxococcota bacterium]|nr:protein-L-isoaspartate(D-aspartate) O-methyltransferase [Myxococcota bacterium]
MQIGTSLTHSLVVLMIAIIACASNAGNKEKKKHDFARLRAAMVENQLAARGIEDKSVLNAMGVVPRHKFVPANQIGAAYADHPLPIGNDQTISQPYIVAYMTEALAIKKGQRILEIGTGSGYQAAILAEMGAAVYTIEIIEALGLRARETLQSLGYKVHARIGDGYKGWPEAAPFDGIIVTAAPLTIPPALVAQLKEGGRLVIPVGNFVQDLKVLKKVAGELKLEKTLPVRFVPMVEGAD